MFTTHNNLGVGECPANAVDVIAYLGPLLRKHNGDADDVRLSVDQLYGPLFIQALNLETPVWSEGDTVRVTPWTINDLDPVLGLFQDSPQIGQPQRHSERSAVRIFGEI